MSYQVKFLLTFFLAIAIGCFVRKRYRVPVIVIILGSMFMTGYLHTYLECNRVSNIKKYDIANSTKII